MRPLKRKFSFLTKTITTIKVFNTETYLLTTFAKEAISIRLQHNLYKVHNLGTIIQNYDPTY